MALKDKIVRIVFGEVFTKSLGFIITIYLAHVLGVEAYGIITAGISFIGYCNWAADLGLGTIGAREIAKAQSSRSITSKEVLIAKILLATLVTICSVAIIQLVDLSNSHRKVLFYFIFAILPIAFNLEWYFNGKQHFGTVAISRTLTYSIYLILVFIFVKSALDIAKVPIFFVAGFISGTVFIGIRSIHQPIFNVAFRGFSSLKKLYISAFQVGIGTFSSSFIQYLPPLLIAWVLSAEDTGIYGAALRLILGAMIIDRIFLQILLPNLSSQWSEDKKKATRNIHHTSKMLILIGASISVGIAISAPFIIHLFYGAEYSESSMVLSVLSIFLFFTFINTLTGYGLIALGKDRESLISTFIGGAFSILLFIIVALLKNLLLIVATVAISEFIFVVSSLYRFNKSIQLPILKSVFLVLVIGGVLYRISMIVYWHPIIEGIIAGLLMILISFLTRIFDRNNVDWFMKKLFQ